MRSAVRSEGARAKVQTRRTPEGWPVQSFDSLLDHLATVARHKVRVPSRPDAPLYDQVTTPDAFRLVLTWT